MMLCHVPPSLFLEVRNADLNVVKTVEAIVMIVVYMLSIFQFSKTTQELKQKEYLVEF